MSDALFFTGQVLKNNRNLIQEEATRQQLAIQKEELELQRQESIRRRKDARSKGVEAESYEVSGMDPFLQEQFQTQVGDYQRFVSENSISIYDGDIDWIANSVSKGIQYKKPDGVYLSGLFLGALSPSKLNEAIKSCLKNGADGVCLFNDECLNEEHVNIIKSFRQ